MWTYWFIVQFIKISHLSWKACKFQKYIKTFALFKQKLLFVNAVNEVGNPKLKLTITAITAIPGNVNLSITLNPYGKM